MRLVGLQNLLIPVAASGSGPADGTAYPSHGGDLPKYLFPHVIAARPRDESVGQGLGGLGLAAAAAAQRGREGADRIGCTIS